MKNYVTGENMECPFCEKNLVEKDKKHYETLSEHVGAPNRTPTLKVGYGCDNKDCEAYKNDLRWIHDGEGPYGGITMNIPKEKYHPRGTWWASYYPQG